MKNFIYSAQTLDGKIIKGSMSAESREALIAQLQTQNIFLISEQSTPIKEPSATFPALAFLQIITRKLKIRNEDRNKVVVIFVICLIVGVWLSGRGTVSRDAAVPWRLKHLANSIHPGMTREEIETKWQPSHHLGTPQKTFYLTSNHIYLYVTYDNTGGIGSPQNRSISEPGFLYANGRD